MPTSIDPPADPLLAIFMLSLFFVVGYLISSGK